MKNLRREKQNTALLAKEHGGKRPLTYRRIVFDAALFRRIRPLILKLRKKMKERYGMERGSHTLASLVFAIVCVSLAAAQDIVPVSDITGGTSVFVFRGNSNSVTKKYVSQAKSQRTKAQRSDNARRVGTQYEKLSKAAPRRERIAAVDPENLPPQIATMPKSEAAKIFAGVGEYYMDRNEYDKAIDFFREANTLDSTNKVARMGLSEALALKGNQLLVIDNLPVAQKFFDEALKLNPNNAPAYFGLGEILSAGGKNDDAVINYEKALSNDKDLTEIFVPLGILYYQQGKYEKAEEMLSRSVSLDPDDAPAQYFSGLVSLSRNKEQDALLAFKRAQKLDPNYAEAFYYAGEAQARLGKSSLAIEEYKRAIALKDNYFEAWYGLGSAYFDVENYREAITAFERAKRLRNDNAEVVANLADAYRQIGDYNQAETNYSLAVLFFERQRDFAQNKATRDLTADIYGRWGFVIAKQCEMNVKRGMSCKWNTAVNALDKASALSHDNFDTANLGWAYYNAARADMAAGRKDEARAKLLKARDNLKQAIETNPGYMQGPLLNLGMVYTDLQDYPAAIETFKKVVAREPKWVFALNELGIAYMNNGNYKEAAAEFRKAVSRDNKFAPAYFNLAHAEYKNGNMGEAKKAYSRLRSLGRADLATRLDVLTGGRIRK